MPPINFELRHPPNVTFGLGSFQKLPSFTHSYSKVAFVIGSRTLSASGVLGPILSGVHGDHHQILLPKGEPTLELVDELTEELTSFSPECVVAIGGGSTLDAAKASSVLMNQPGRTDVIAYLEGIGDGEVITHSGTPLIAVPTTAGTGSEATINSVVASPRHGVKKSLRHPHLLPNQVVIDPELQVTCDLFTTLHSGLDAITQCFESYISCRATPHTRLLALEGLRTGWNAINRVIANPNDVTARSSMAYCAYLSGVALANGGLGVAHGLASSLGVAAGITHGHACAILLPFAASFNNAYCEDDYTLICQTLGIASDQGIVRAIESLTASHGITKSFLTLGISKNDLIEVVGSSFGNSMRGNPYLPCTEELLEALLGYYY